MLAFLRAPGDINRKTAHQAVLESQLQIPICHIRLAAKHLAFSSRRLLEPRSWGSLLMRLGQYCKTAESSIARR